MRRAYRIFVAIRFLLMRLICFFLCSVSVVLISCNNSIHGNGQFVDEDRNVTDYTNVISTGNFDVVLTNDPSGVVRLHGESSVLPHIETVVDGNILMISYEEGMAEVEHDNVTVYVPAFGVEQFMLQGSGSVVAKDTLDTPGFALEIAGSGDADLVYNGSRVFTTVSGSGNVTLSGQANEAHHTITGSGKINARDHVVHRCNVIITGMGDADVYADSVLDVAISGSGNVRYRGNPVVNKHITVGSGTVEPE